VNETDETDEPDGAEPDEETPRIKFSGMRHIFFGELSEPKWAIRGLQFCPGRPVIMGGYGSAGKTLILQSLALACVTGRLIWGQFRPDGRLIVRHLDYEQGDGATRWRYRRLALGHDISQEELEDLVSTNALDHAPFPEVYLTSPNAYDAFMRAVEGANILILDALRGATPGEDENDSAMRVYLDLLSRVSSAQGCTIIVLHHAKKGDGKTSAAQLLRGSSAIYDGAGAIFMAASEEQNAPKYIEQTRPSQDARGQMIEPFYLKIEDVLIGTDPTGGLRVSYRTKEQIERPEVPSERLAAVILKITEAVRKKPGVGTRALIELVKGDKDLIKAGLDEAERTSILEMRRNGRAHTWWVK